MENTLTAEETVISFEGVSKKFRKSLRQSMIYGFRDVSMNMLGIPARTEILRPGEFWALDDVSFQVRRGETLGIIGPNGAGKTTILKLISGIILPDKGRIETKGRIGSLIEIGAGFHPMLTGRENIYVNGSILGMSRREIDERRQDIISFADIGDFIDSPVKYYSSGMYVRLGFSVAVHCKPDILLVDEVLAVGDYDFQYKCMHLMEKLKSAGTTIIFISHNMTTVRGFCDRAVFLNRGRAIDAGNAEDMVKKYYLSSHVKTPGRKESSGLAAFPLTGNIEITGAKVTDEQNNEKKNFLSGESSILSITLKVHRDINGFIAGFQFFNRAGLNVYGTNTNWLHSETLKTRYAAGTSICVRFRQNLSLSPDVYYITMAVANPAGTIFHDWKDSFLEFRIVSDMFFEGVANLKSSAEITEHEL